MEDIQEITKKENISCKKGSIVIEDTALNIRSCGERLKAAAIQFHIVPEFKYEIQPYKEITEEFLMDMIKNQKIYSD